MSPPAEVLHGDCSGVRFAPVAGFPGYEVSDDGRLWSNKRPSRAARDGWYELQGGKDKDGYRKAILCGKGVRRHVRIHVLVLETFVGPCPPGLEGRHLNGKQDDNRLSNLEWATHAVNLADKERHGTRQVGSRASHSKIDERIAAEVKRKLAAGGKPTQVAVDLGISVNIVGNIKYGAWAHVPWPKV